MITVYVKPGNACSQCVTLKRWLERHGLVEGEDYELIDVTAEDADLTEFHKHDYKQVPVTFLSPEDHFYGFDITRLTAWLEERA